MFSGRSGFPKAQFLDTADVSAVKERKKHLVVESATLGYKATMLTPGTRSKCVSLSLCTREITHVISGA